MSMPGFLASSRRKIRLIECNAKCRDLRKFTCKGTLRQVFYLSKAPLPSYDPILLPPLHTVNGIQYTNSHREGGRGGELTSEKVRGVIVHSMTDYISSL
jgi:hypothetical protein